MGDVIRLFVSGDDQAKFDALDNASKQEVYALMATARAVMNGVDVSFAFSSLLGSGGGLEAFRIGCALPSRLYELAGRLQGLQIGIVEEANAMEEEDFHGERLDSDEE